MSIEDYVSIQSLISNFAIMATENRAGQTSLHHFNPQEHMDGVPLFNGENLFRFINSCNHVVENFVDGRQNFSQGQNVRILNSIKKRISDECYKRLSVYPLDNWELLKFALLDCFGDSRSEEHLLLELMNLRQNHLHLDDYYSQFIEIAQLLILKSNNAQHTFYNNLILKKFTGNLYAPLSAAVKALNPTNLPQAYQRAKEFIQEHPEYYQNNIKNRLNTNFNVKTNISHKTPPKPKFNHFSYFPNSSNNKYQNQNVNFTQPNNTNNGFNPSPSNQFHRNQPFPTGPVQYQTRNIPQRFLTNKQVFGNPKNVFGPGKGHPPTQNHTPMSISTRNTKQNQPFKNHFQSNNNQRQNFISEELFHHNNHSNHYDNNYNNYANNYDYDQETHTPLSSHEEVNESDNDSFQDFQNPGPSWSPD